MIDIKEHIFCMAYWELGMQFPFIMNHAENLPLRGTCIGITNINHWLSSIPELLSYPKIIRYIRIPFYFEMAGICTIHLI